MWPSGLCARCVPQVSLHPVLDKTTFHLMNKRRLSMMKKVRVTPAPAWRGLLPAALRRAIVPSHS